MKSTKNPPKIPPKVILLFSLALCIALISGTMNYLGNHFFSQKIPVEKIINRCSEK